MAVYYYKVNIKLGCKSVDLIQLAQYKAQFKLIHTNELLSRTQSTT